MPSAALEMFFRPIFDSLNSPAMKLNRTITFLPGLCPCFYSHPMPHDPIFLVKRDNCRTCCTMAVVGCSLKQDTARTLCSWRDTPQWHENISWCRRKFKAELWSSFYQITITLRGGLWCCLKPSLWVLLMEGCVLRHGAQVALQIDQLQVDPSYFRALTFLLPDTRKCVSIR